MSLESLGIRNEKIFLEKLLNKDFDSIIKNNTLDYVIKTIENEDYNILKIRGKTYIYYVFYSKIFLKKGGYGKISDCFTVVESELVEILSTNISDLDKLISRNIEYIISKVKIIIPKIVKYPINLDQDNLEETLIENIIMSIIYLNKVTRNFVPKLMNIYYNNNTIDVIMEKMEGSINDYLKEKLIISPSKKIFDDYIISYLLQISYILYKLYDEFDFNHRDFKTNNTTYRKVNVNKQFIVKTPKIEFTYPTFGFEHCIIDFGFSCIESVKPKKISLSVEHDDIFNKICQNSGRDLTQLIYQLLNTKWILFTDKIIGYLGYILDINGRCKLWRNFKLKKQNKFSKTKNINVLCNNVNHYNRNIYKYVNHPNFNNTKSYPLRIIEDIYKYKKTGELPYSEKAVIFYKKITNTYDK